MIYTKFKLSLVSFMTFGVDQHHQSIFWTGKVLKGIIWFMEGMGSSGSTSRPQLVERPTASCALVFRCERQLIVK